MTFALIGKPLGHSLSPLIHEKISEVTGHNCDYMLRPLEPHEVRPFIRGFSLSGIDGINVTIPYKTVAADAVDACSPEAKAIGAVNTISVGRDGLTGHNTDYHGFLAMLAAAGIDPRGKQCVLLGSGGSARAVAAALMDSGASELLIASRDAAQAAQRFPGLGAIDYAALGSTGGYLLINCTPVGMYPLVDVCPVEQAVVGCFEAVADLIYNPRQTQLLQAAQAAGCAVADGLHMLVAQAVKAREIWHGVGLGADVEQKVIAALGEAGVAQ